MEQQLIDPGAVASLRRTVAGRVAYPTDPVYDGLVTGHNTAVEHRPTVVVEAVTEADVVATVAVARQHRLPLHVQATGHGATTSRSGGILLLTGRLTGVRLDPEAGTATVGAGVVWGDLLAVADAHGLAPVPTSGAGIGVVGSLLGGGVGPLARRQGLCSDHVVGLRVVTVDGRIHDVPATDELAWALLGGRAGIGVVTSVTVRLAGTPVVSGGARLVRGAAAPAALADWLAWSADLSDATTTSAQLVTLAGQQALRITVCSTDPGGDTGPVAPEILSLRAWVERHGDPSTPAPTWQRGFLLTDAGTELADVLVEAVQPPAPVLGVEVRRLGGALDGPAQHAAELAGAEYLVSVIGAPDPRLFADAVPAHARRLARHLEPWLTGGSLLNFHGVADDLHPLDLCWSAATAERLARVRRSVDPEGLLA